MPPPGPLAGKRHCGGAVKQVTRSNFAEALRQLRDDVKEADFIAVSTQKTGSAFFRSFSASSLPSYTHSELSAGQRISPWWRRVLPIDTVETAYLKAKVAAEQFELLQFAVCPFRFQGSKVVAHPYNFHLFPRDEWNVGMPSYSFACQMSVLTSMAQEGFDFNACIYDGISYLSRVQESMTKDWNHITTVAPITPFSGSSAADAIFMERIKSRIQQWRNACATQTSEHALVRSLKKLMLGSQVYGSRPCINVDVCNNRQVQLVMQVLRQSFENLVPLIIPDKGGQPKEVKVVMTSSEDDKNILLREIQNLEEENDRKLRGFREVIDMISSSHKPVISYQALNDFTFIHSKFVGPLPPSMTEFMCSLRLVFSTIIDISYLLKEIGPLRKANNISAVMSYLRREFFMPTNMETPGQADKSVDKNHGYSVLMIAKCFAKLNTLLKIDPISCQSTTQVSSIGIQKYANIFNHTCVVIRENEQTVDVLMNDLRKVRITDLIFLWGFGAMSSGELKHKLYGTHDAFSEDFDLKLIDKSCAVVVFWKANTAQTLLRDVRSGNIYLGSPSEMMSDGLRVAGYEAYKKLCALGLCGMELADAFDKVSCESICDPSISIREETLEMYWKK